MGKWDNWEDDVDKYSEDWWVCDVCDQTGEDENGDECDECGGRGGWYD